MDVRTAASFIADAVPRARATWADLGAGNGTFTKALASLLEPGSRIYAVDQDPKAIAALEKAGRSLSSTVEVIPVHADFTTAPDLGALDGVLFANSLHYVPYEEQPAVVRRILLNVAPSGRLIVVDYDGRAPNRWVPYPLSLAHLTTLTTDLGLGAPRVVGTRPSAYGGTMYAAYLDAKSFSRHPLPVEDQRTSR